MVSFGNTTDKSQRSIELRRLVRGGRMAGPHAEPDSGDAHFPCAVVDTQKGEAKVGADVREER